MLRDGQSQELDGLEVNGSLQHGNSKLISLSGMNACNMGLKLWVLLVKKFGGPPCEVMLCFCHLARRKPGRFFPKNHHLHYLIFIIAFKKIVVLCNRILSIRCDCPNALAIRARPIEFLFASGGASRGFDNSPPYDSRVLSKRK